MNSPKTLCFRLMALMALVGGSLTSCAVSPNGPATSGASHGSLGSTDMADYYYKKDAGWTYVFRNVERIYNTDGTLSQTLTGANDTVRTMGFAGISAPNNDSVFRVTISYRVLTAYAGRAEMNLRYVCDGSSQHGAFIDGNATIMGAVTVDKKPRPVSTDTIMAGVAGRVRTVADNFSNLGDFTWQIDTLYFTAHGDSVFLWEHFPGSTSLSPERLLFCKDMANNGVNWMYDLVNQQTYFRVRNSDLSLTVPAGTWSHTSEISVVTPAVADNMPITEYKWFGCGAGLIQQFDEWYVTTDGSSRNKQDFTRTLISLTH